MKRLFIAIPVSEELKQLFTPLLKELRATEADCSFVSLDQVHYTLKFLGDIEEKGIPTIISLSLLEEVAAAQKKFALSVKGVGVFPSLERIRIVWVGGQSTEYQDLSRKVKEKLQFTHQEEHEEDTPHLTIARVKSEKNKLLLQEFVQKWKDHVFGEMTIDKIILYNSILTPHGAKHSIVKEFKLQR